MKLDISSPWPFRVTGEQTNLNKAWEQYLKHFEMYIKAANITMTVRKRGTAFTHGWYEGAKHFWNITDQGTSYAQAAAKLSEYFQPKKNISNERYVFHKAKQRQDETW